MKQIQPHRHNGRFYNDAHDSIIARLKNVPRVLWSVIKQGLKGHRRNKVLLGDHRIEAWIDQSLPLAASQDLVVTWIGHAAFLMQIDGFNIVTDPVFSDISYFVKRLIKSPIQPHHLPPIDVIVISHNHADHTDKASLRALVPHQPRVFVPMGNKAWFEKLGFLHVTEMMWGDKAAVTKVDKELTITFLPASHWTGRGLFDINTTLWGSWMLSTTHDNVYFAGDTAYDKHFAHIATLFPSITLALMPIGPNEPRTLLYDAHISAQEAVKAFLTLGARHFIPMHWGTFMFGLEGFHGPLQRLKESWKLEGERMDDKVMHVVKFGEQRRIVGDAPVELSHEQQGHTSL